MIPSILNRRSIRKYKDTPVPREAIEEILYAGSLAPSSKNRQPWKFIVVSGEAKKEMLEAMGRGLAREKEGRDALLPESRQHISGAEHTLHIMEQAPVNLFIINPLGLDLDSPATPEQRIYEICNAQSIGAAVENMTLAAEGLGFGSLWICDLFFAYRELNQWLGVQGTLAAAMALGYADEAPGPRPRKSMDDLAAWRS